MIGDNQKEQGFVTVATKVSESMAHVLNQIARAKGIKVYELMQLVCWFLVKYTSDEHNLSEDMQKLMILFHSEVGWKEAFNLCNPSADTEIAQEILILQQTDKRGFGAVMIDKPFMGKWTETENVNQIVARVLNVCLPDVYMRLRRLATMKGVQVIEQLAEMVDNETFEYINEQNRLEMQGATMTDTGRGYAYGAKTKSLKHRTPDSLANSQQRIQFDDDDRDVADYEAQGWEGEHKGNSDDGLVDGTRPFTEEY